MFLFNLAIFKTWYRRERGQQHTEDRTTRLNTQAAHSRPAVGMVDATFSTFLSWSFRPVEFHLYPSPHLSSIVVKVEGYIYFIWGLNTSEQKKNCLQKILYTIRGDFARIVTIIQQFTQITVDSKQSANRHVLARGCRHLSILACQVIARQQSVLNRGSSSRSPHPASTPGGGAGTVC